jgi:CRP-like cAMP-binding protein
MREYKSTGVHYSSFVRRRNGEKDPGAALECPPLFSDILPGESAQIFAAGRVREFARGEVLYIEGDPVRQVLLLISGLVKITKLGTSGTEVILRLGGPGDVLGAADPFSIGTHGTTAQAFRLCRALVWEASVFKALVAPFPVLHKNMARIVGGHLLELEERFREMATEKVGPRVARQVVRLLEQIGRPLDGAVVIGVSREELAQMTGTTLFTVSRLFSAWEALGFVKPRREAVVISNVEALRAIAQGDAAVSCNRGFLNREFGQFTPNEATA